MARRWNLPAWKRDSLLVAFALTLGAVNAVFLGAQTSTYTFALGILLSPVVLRAEDPKPDGPKGAT